MLPTLTKPEKIILYEFLTSFLVTADPDNDLCRAFRKIHAATTETLQKELSKDEFDNLVADTALDIADAMDHGREIKESLEPAKKLYRRLLSLGNDEPDYRVCVECGTAWTKEWLKCGKCGCTESEIMML